MSESAGSVRAAPLQLRERLRALAPEAAAALRRLHAQGAPLRFGDDGARWWLAPLRTPAGGRSGVQLRAPQAGIVVDLAADVPQADIGPRAWWDYSGDARLLAWSLAHEGFVQRLGRAFGAAWLPQAFVDDDAQTLAGFEFRLHDGDDCWRGRLGLDAQALALLAARAQSAEPAGPPGPWRRLPVGLRVLLPGPPIAAAELRPAGCGDVLMLGARNRCLNALSLRLDDGAAGADHSGRWSARLRDGRLTITSAGDAPQPWTDADMKPTPRPEPARSEAAAADPARAAEPSQAPDRAAAVLDSVPVQLDFELGRLSLTIGELEKLQPGYVFELPQPLEGMRVIVRANGRAIGRGELVALGELLGVQLLELDARGIQ